MKPFLLDFWLHYKRVDRNPPSFELTANLQFRHPSEKPPFYRGPILLPSGSDDDSDRKESPVDLLSFFIPRKQTRESKEATTGILSIRRCPQQPIPNKSKMKDKKNRNSLTGRLSISIPSGMIFLLPGSLA